MQWEQPSYAIVSRSDMNDAILKLQESENRVEQERLQAEEQQEQIRAIIYLTRQPLRNMMGVRVD